MKIEPSDTQAPKALVSTGAPASDTVRVVAVGVDATTRPARFRPVMPTMPEIATSSPATSLWSAVVVITPGLAWVTPLINACAAPGAASTEISDSSVLLADTDVTA